MYRVPPAARPADLSPTLALGVMWQPMAASARWTPSPGTLEITSPSQQLALLHVTLASMFDPAAPNGFGASGTLAVQNGDHVHVIEVTAGTPFTVPLRLIPGRQTVALSLLTGKFRLSKYGGVDPTMLSFAIRSINLETLNVATTAVTEAPLVPLEIFFQWAGATESNDAGCRNVWQNWYTYEPSN